MVSALKKYHGIHIQFPGRIVVYRDGVGDGMLDMVYRHEVPQFKAAFAALQFNPGYVCVC